MKLDITAGFKVVMARHGVSVNDLARKRGVSNRAIQLAFNGDAIKKISGIAEYCELIGCRVSELMTESEIAYKSKKGE